MVQSENIQIRLATELDGAGIRNVQVATWKVAYKGMLPDEILKELTRDKPPMQITSINTLIGTTNLSLKKLLLVGS